MASRQRQSLAAGWFLGQAVAVTVWWAAVLSSERIADLFFVTKPWPLLRSFLAGDIALLVLGSAMSAWAVGKNRPSAIVFAWLTAGGTLYAWLFSLSWNWPLGQRPLADLGMTFIGFGSIWAATQIKTQKGQLA